MTRTSRCLLTAAALFTSCCVAFAGNPVTVAEPNAAISRQLLLVKYPGLLLADTPIPGAPADRLSSFALPEELPAPVTGMASVTLPGISPRSAFADNLHWLLGVATVVAGGVTGVMGMAQEEGGGSASIHHALGYTTAGLAAATLVTGFWAHHGDVGVSDGFSTPNVHALFAIAGGVLLIVTPFVADAGGGGEDDGGAGHAALGIAGEVLLGVAVIWPLLF